MTQGAIGYSLGSILITFWVWGSWIWEIDGGLQFLNVSLFSCRDERRAAIYVDVFIVFIVLLRE